MNEKFFSLPEEKQRRITNAGFRIFAHHSYKKAPVGEIAAEAGISKSLLFHYFHNKKEFYFYLWKVAGEITIEYLEKYRCYELTDLFEVMYQGMYAKLEIMKSYPNLTAFSLRSFYEKDPEVAGEVQKLYFSVRHSHDFDVLSHIDFSKFREGLDLAMMQKEMFLASEGYLWEILQRGESVDPERLKADFTELLEFWRTLYYKEEYLKEGRLHEKHDRN